jgi:hypothetical protein
MHSSRAALSLRDNPRHRARRRRCWIGRSPDLGASRRRESEPSKLCTAGHSSECKTAGIRARCQPSVSSDGVERQSKRSLVDMHKVTTPRDNFNAFSRCACTARGLGINARSLGISPRQLDGLNTAELARAFRRAGEQLFRLAAELEEGRPR